MGWRSVHWVAMASSFYLLAAFLYEIASTGNLMLPARPSAQPASAAQVLFMAIWLSSCAATALRGLWVESQAD